MAEEFEDELDDDKGDDEMREKMRRVERKFDRFLDDIAEDVIEPEVLAKVERKILKLLHEAGVPATFGNIKAFSAGFDFGMKSTMKLEGNVAQLMIAIHRFVKEKEAKKPKVEIDITKSLPLPPEHGSDKSE